MDNVLARLLDDLKALDSINPLRDLEWLGRVVQRITGSMILVFNVSNQPCDSDSICIDPSAITELVYFIEPHIILNPVFCPLNVTALGESMTVYTCLYSNPVASHQVKIVAFFHLEIGDESRMDETLDDFDAGLPGPWDSDFLRVEDANVDFRAEAICLLAWTRSDSGVDGLTSVIWESSPLSTQSNSADASCPYEDLGLQMPVD
ncbi:hypothetical protein Tco_0133110 [Tanacetum coccineum]